MLSGADKADAVQTGVTRDKSAFDFPACGVVSALWMIDLPAAALLKASNGAGDGVQCIYHN